MSCFTLPPEHIAAIVGSLQGRGALGVLKPLGASSIASLCKMLAGLNAASVRNNYGGYPKPVEVSEDMVNAFVVCPLSPIDTLQAIKSFEHQSCEARGHQWTVGSKVIEGLKEAAISVIIRRANPSAWNIGSLPEGAESIVRLT